MESVADKFLRYIKIDTQSSEEMSDNSPSTQKQHNLAELLYNELREMGVSDVRYDKEYCYVYAKIEANNDEEKQIPSIGFIAHMDTSEAVSGENINPVIIEKYDGRDIILNKEKNIVTRVSEFPMLKACVGKSLIVTDGNTLLGGDDKAGVAEIMSMAEYFMTHPKEKHGRICIGFTPDEEIGRGVDFFDIDGFGADYAYTVDGGELGDMSFECFNAAAARLTAIGKSVHPGYAKNIMRNAIKMIYEFLEQLPSDEAPENTQDYEGFYHITDIKGDVEKATADFIIRDHDKVKFEDRKKKFIQIAEILNIKYGENIFEIEIKDSYYNMREVIEKDMFIVDIATNAMREVGVEPKIAPIRGGTDGARLSFAGLPCPNLCTGSEGHHGRNEFACIQDMEKIVEILKRIVVSL